MDGSKIKIIGLLALAFLAAIYLGVAAATAQVEAISWIVGGLMLAGCIALGTKIWMLIPIAMAMPLSFPFLPGGPTILQVAILAACFFSILLLTIRRLSWRPQLGGLELAMLLLLASILQVYMRNPTGLNIFGTGNIGGRAYLEVVLAVAGALLLFGLHISYKELRTVALANISFGIASTLVGVAAFIVPAIAVITGPVVGAWGRSSPTGMVDMGGAAGDADRKVPFREFGLRLGDWIIYRINPLKSLIHPLWLIVLLTSVACVMISGFRSTLAGLMMALGLAAYYRGGVRALMLGLLVGVLSVAGLAVINLMIPLPPNVQRALTFLPGTWEERYESDAEGSTTWRVEMWKAALFTDTYISNKILGDGLGISVREAAMQQTLEAMKLGGSSSGFDLQREYALMVGDYHSGPVHTVRTTGYVGLVILWIVFGLTAWRAHKLLKRVRGTPLFGVCCLFCIPTICHPLFFTFIFGAFGPDVALLIIRMGLLRMMERMVAQEMSEWAAVETAPAGASAIGHVGFASAGRTRPA